MRFIPLQKSNTPPPTNQKIKDVLNITINYILWRGSSSGDLGGMDYSFIAITSRFSLNLSGSIY